MSIDDFYNQEQLRAFRHRLSYIQQEADDFIWVDDHSDDIAQTLEAALQDTHLYFPVVETLMALLATGLVYETCDIWLTRLIQIVLDHPVESLNPFQNAFQDALRQFQPLAGMFGTRGQQPDDQTDKLLQAYITLLKTLDFNRGMLINEQLIEQANKLVSAKPRERLYSEYFQALALYYAHRGELELGVLMGLQAFNIYEYRHDAPGSADAALTLAILYRLTHEAVKARFYLDAALVRAKQEGNRNKKLATMIYEQGSLAFKADKFPEALYYWQQALEIFEEYDALYQIAMTHHAIGMCYYELSQLDKTEPEIKTARELWTKIDNRYELAALQMLEGQVEFRRGHDTLGLNLMNRALEMARLLPESPARDRLIESMEKFIDQHYPPLVWPTIHLKLLN